MIESSVTRVTRLPLGTDLLSLKLDPRARIHHCCSPLAPFSRSGGPAGRRDTHIGNFDSAQFSWAGSRSKGANVARPVM